MRMLKFLMILEASFMRTTETCNKETYLIGVEFKWRLLMIYLVLTESTHCDGSGVNTIIHHPFSSMEKAYDYVLRQGETDTTIHATLFACHEAKQEIHVLTTDKVVSVDFDTSETYKYWIIIKEVL